MWYKTLGRGISWPRGISPKFNQGAIADELHGKGVVICYDGPEMFQPLDPQNQICAANGEDMEICLKPLTLYVQGNIRANKVTIQQGTVAHHYFECVG